MPLADALSDINSALATAPAANDDGKSAPPAHPALADVDAALSGKLPPPKPETQRANSSATNIAAGANSGLIAGTLGFPVDAATAALNLVPRTINSAGRALGYQPDVGLIDNPVGGSGWIDQQLGKTGVGVKGIAPAATTTERIEQGVGQGIGAMAGPNVLAKGRALTGIAGPAAEAVQDALAAGSVKANAGIGAASGGIGQAAAEAVPEEYKPYAYLAGSLVPGGVLAGGAALATAAGRGTANAYRSMPPLSAATRETMAGANAVDRLRGAASDPGAAFDNLSTAPRELVPGSTPTTAEISDDVGLLGAQRQRQTNNPAFGREIQEQSGANNTARMSYLEEMAPPAASIEDTQTTLRNHLATIDAAGDQAMDASRQNAGTALAPALPRLQPEETGTIARNAVEAERAPQSAALTESERGAQGSLDEAAGKFGGQEALGSPEQIAAAPSQYGAAMREPLAAAYAAEQQRLRALRDSIDPTGTMGMKPDAIKQAVGQIGDMFPAEGGAQLSGPERNLYSTVADWGGLIPIERAFQLRANINGRIRGLQGSDPQEVLRLGLLKNGVDDALAQAAADVHTGEQTGVIHQGMPAIGERIGGLENNYGIGPSFAQDVAKAYANNPATLRAAGRDETGRGILEAANSGNEPVRPGALSSGANGRGNEGGRSGSGASDQGVPQNPELTPLTPEARQTFADWNNQYREMGRTFRGETPGTLHSVGKILQKGGAYDSYRLTDAETPWVVANKGANARQAVDRFLAAAPPEAHAALDDAMAFSLRRAAQNPDGSLNLPKYETWLKQYGGALSARPELQTKFATAAQAQRSLDDIRQSLAQHAAENPLKPGWQDASLLGRFFKPGPDGGQQMREYQRITGNRPEAAAAAADHAAYSFANAAVRNGEVVPRLAETWLRNHDEALSAVPGLKDKFANATEAQRSLERAVEAHEQARSSYTKSVAGAFIQDDPARAIQRVFSGANRQQKAALLMDLTRGSQAAREGLQRGAVDFIRSHFEGGALPGSEDGALMPKRFADFVDQNRDVLATLFPGRVANFDAIAADLKRGTLVQNAKTNRAGSDTTELTAGRDHGAHGNDIGTASMMLLAEHAGQHAGHHLIGGVMGKLAAPVAAVGSLVGKMIFNKAKGALAMREDALFDRMLMDPDFALDMNRVHPSQMKATPESIGARLRGRLVQQAIMSARTQPQ